MKNTIYCPAERAIYFLGGKWKIRILFSLLNNKIIRFGELKKGLKTITQQMLSKQLKELEIDGIVNHKISIPNFRKGRGAESLNVAIAGAIFLSEIFRGR